MSFFRYPGGKAKLKEPILNRIKSLVQDKEIEVYSEPFFGGGSVCFAVLRDNIFPDLKAITINDFDYGIYALWHSVVYNPYELMLLVKEFTPTIRAFYLYKAELESDIKSQSLVSIGFKKLAVHQMSYSGLGLKAGGPIGGKSQTSKYDVGCRWSQDSIIKKIDKYHRILNKYETFVISHDFADVIFPNMCGPFFFYLDPPYYVKGNDLYHVGFSENDHNRLGTLLKSVKNPWLLSYDDCEQIRDLYSWAEIEEVDVNYSITTARSKTELLIYPKQ